MKERVKLYKSKIDSAIAIFTVSIFLLVGFTILKTDELNYFGIIFYVLTLLFIVHVSMTTNYFIVDEKELIIKSSFLVNIKIDIKTITCIEETKSLISSPALSTDRLKIFYNKYDSVIISPKNKIDFIKDLKSVNSLIIIN